LVAVYHSCVAAQNPFQITLQGGPLDGQCHELQGGLLPAFIGLNPDDPTSLILHWYKIGNDGTAQYDTTGERPASTS
jgi:hypothetical protein